MIPQRIFSPYELAHRIFPSHLNKALLEILIKIHGKIRKFDKFLDGNRYWCGFTQLDKEGSPYLSRCFSEPYRPVSYHNATDRLSFEKIPQNQRKTIKKKLSVFNANYSDSAKRTVT